MAHIPYGGDLIGISPAFTDADLELHNQHKNSADTIARFSNVLIHQLNNLLTVNIGYVERAQKLATNPLQRRNLESARQGADGMSETLLQLQCFASTSYQSGESTCIVGALNDALDLVKMKDPGLDVQVVVDQPQRIDANSVETTRMFMNLLENCMDGCEGDDRKVSIRVRDITSQFHPLGLPDGDYVVITIADNGRGIAPNYLAQIFEPFFTTKPGHAGMGLSWVWGFVKKSQGTIRVRSEINGGTSFEIFLPFGVNMPRRVQASITSIRKNPHRRVLIVEDNPAVLDIIHSAMTAMNFQITTASTSLDAQALIDSQTFELVIADLMIPGELSGSDVADLNLDANPMAKVLLITGRLDRQNIAVNSDYHLLVKPFSMEKLTKTIKMILP